jgi:ABC-type Mn2+/Zn2+ transport system ATPase subunit
MDCFEAQEDVLSMTENRSEQRPVATLTEATVGYPHRGSVLRNISFSLYPGSQVAIVGPNGAGKTTLFRAMLGLVPVTHGSIELFGASPSHARSRVAYVPQREDVDWQFPLTAEDIVMMSRINAVFPGCRPSPKDRDIVASALARVGMLDLRQTPISQLSGGQQQRVFLARALAQEPDLFLLDEPFNEVDAATQELLLALLDEFAAVDRTVVVATHDLRLARHRFPEVLLLNKELVAFGSAEEVFQPGLLEKAYSGQIVFWQSDNNRGTTKS